MRFRIRVIAAGLLATIVVSGCAQAASSRQATVLGCTAVAVRAIRSHVPVDAMPAACRGLSPAALDQAITEAIDEAAGNHPKAIWRHRAYLASFSLGYLIAAASRATSTTAAPPAAPAVSAPGVGRPGGLVIPAGPAALIAWLLTAGSGSYLLVRWAAHGGLRRGRTRTSGLSPGVILTHFGLAIGGLAVWLGYLLAHFAALAWLALGFLLPVTGLGIATLILALPDSAQASPIPASAVPAGAVPTGARTDGAGLTSPARHGMPVVVIAAHGALATATLLLVLLAAVAAR